MKIYWESIRGVCGKLLRFYQRLQDEIQTREVDADADESKKNNDPVDVTLKNEFLERFHTFQKSLQSNVLKCNVGIRVVVGAVAVWH